MYEFLRGQTDFIYLISCLSCLILAAVCFTAGKGGGGSLSWGWLGVFGLTRGVHQWLGLLTYSLGDGPILQALRVCALAASFLFLAEFGRTGIIAHRGRGPGRWIYLPLLALAVAGGVAGPAGLEASSGYALGAAAGILVAGAFVAASLGGKSRRMAAGGAAAGLYVAVTGLVVPGGTFFPATVINQDAFLHRLGFPVQLLEAVLILGLAVFIWTCLQRCTRGETGRHKIDSRSKHTALSVVVFLAILAFGWGITQYWGERAVKILREDGRNQISALSNLIAGELSKADYAAAALSGSPWIARALISGESADIDLANSVLDRFKESHHASVCYLIDASGRTVASSNRGSPDSFVGQFYGFRPYFRDAVEGTAGRYFALGVTSRERGYYASSPVRDSVGNIIGAVAVKNNIGRLEAGMMQYPYCFFIDPNGVIFLSSRPEMLFKGLWPLDKGTREILKASNQFGDVPFEAVLPAKVEDGSFFDYQGKRFLMNQRYTGPGQWSIVIMNQAFQASWYRLFCISTTLILFVLAIVFTVALRLSADSAARITASERRYHSLVECSPNGIQLFDREGRFITINPSGLETMGWSGDGIAGKKFSEVWPPGIRPRVEEALHQVMEGRQVAFEAEYARPDGGMATLHLVLSPIFEPDGVIRNFVGISTDITERRHREEQLRLQAAALESAANAIVITGLDGRITWINPAFTNLTGYTSQEVLGRKMDILKSGQQDRLFYRILWETIFSGRVWHGEMINRRKDGSLYCEEQTITPVRDGRGEISHFIAVKQDITLRKQQEQQLSHLATHDSLTGLPNRRLLEEALKRAVARARRGFVSTLLFMDLDNFKVVNDTMGHAAGDQVLLTLTRLVKGVLRAEDLLARFGGDELAVLLEGTGAGEGLAIADRMRREVEEFDFIIKGHSFHLTLSIGLVVIDGRQEPGTALSQADTAMYMAKDQGRNRVAVYQPDEGTLERLSEVNHWVARIMSALAEDRFVLHYQPVVRISDRLVDHYEAFIRMKGEDGEIIAPGSFIPPAERFGLMPQLDRWVFDRATSVLRDHPGIRLYMNISGISLADDSFLDYIEDSVTRSGVDPSRFGFEIAETAAEKDLAAVERQVKRLKAMGFLIALDDSGSGFNSFIYLQKLLVDRVKIDGYHIRELENDPARRALVQATHDLAVALGAVTVAKYVENEGIAESLKAIGIVYGQGYFLHQPGPDLP